MRLGVNGRFLAARPTGVQRFGLETLRALSTMTEVTLLVPRDLRPPAALPVEVARTVAGVLVGPLWEQLELPRLARRAGVDVVLHPANAAPLFGGPHVLVLHDVMPLSRPTDFTTPYRAWFRVAHVEAARRAAAVVTVSEWSAREISARIGLPHDRVGVVRQGVAPLDRPAPLDRVAALRSRLGLEAPFFVAVGAGDPRKGAAFLQEVWRSSGWEAPPDLVIVGEGYAGVHRGGRAGGEGLRSFRYVGHVSDEDLRALYSGAVALLHPSADEGFGRPPLEALACGTRVLVGPYGPAREVLGDTADIIPLAAASWQTAIESVLTEDPGRRSERVSRGACHAARFRWDETATALLRICRACVELGP